jgi:anti-anti-sigma factor
VHTALYEKKLGNALIIRLSGDNEQDIQNLAAIDPIKIENEGIGHLAISMERVAFFYSATINRLVELYKTLSDKNITVSLIHVPDRVRTIISGVRLDKHINIYRSEYDFILAHNLLVSDKTKPEAPQEMFEFGIHRECTNEKGQCIFTISGALIEAHHASQLYELVEGVLNEGFKEIIIDISKTTYIDSINAGTFVKTFKACAAKRARFEVKGANRLVAEVFHLTGIDTLFSCSK